VWSTLATGISPVPTSPKVRAELLSLLPPGLEGDVLELGAAWGSLAWPLAAQLPGAHVVAWEASPVPFAFMWLRRLVQPRRNLSLRFGDFRGADLRHARLVVTYLWTGGMAALAPRFEAELPDGAVVLSHTFAWRGKTPEVIRHARDIYRTPVYRYVVRRPAETHHVAVSVTPE
jgi:hypothetical protein